MKQVIEGKMYNTETATYVGSFQYLYPGDFRYYYEELYRKKTGEYFLYGEGDGLSPYAEYCGSGWCFGKDIRPMCLDEAKEWVEKHLSTGVYIAEFGEPEE